MSSSTTGSASAKRKRRPQNALPQALARKMQFPEYFRGTSVAKWTVRGYAKALIRSNPDKFWSQRSVLGCLGRDVKVIKAFATSSDYQGGASRITKEVEDMSPFLEEWMQNIVTYAASISKEKANEEVGAAAKRVKITKIAVAEIERERDEMTDDHQDFDKTPPRQLATPRVLATPSHQYWLDAVSGAKAIAQPYKRLSIPGQVRTKWRHALAENSLHTVQSIIERLEGSNDHIYQDLGDLTDYLLRNIRRLPVQNPSAVDAGLLHVLGQGRGIRNSPVHVRQHGDESAPWSSDFVFVTRAALHVALVEKSVGLFNQRTKEDDGRVEFAQVILVDACAHAAMSARARVLRSSKINDVRAALVKATTAEAGPVEELGHIRWTFLARQLQKASDQLVDELEFVLTKVFGRALPNEKGLREVLKPFFGFKKNVLDRSLNFYGGINWAHLAAGATFSYDESYLQRERAAKADLTWTLLHLGSIIEFFITLKTSPEILAPWLELWEGFIVALCENVDLSAYETRMAEEDDNYRRDQGLASSPCEDVDDVFSPWLSPLPAALGRSSSASKGPPSQFGTDSLFCSTPDRQKVGPGAFATVHEESPSLAVSRPALKRSDGWSSKHDDDTNRDRDLEPEEGDDEESLALKAKLRLLRKKKRMRNEIAALQGKLEE